MSDLSGSFHGSRGPKPTGPIPPLMIFPFDADVALVRLQLIPTSGDLHIVPIDVEQSRSEDTGLEMPHGTVCGRYRMAGLGRLCWNERLCRGIGPRSNGVTTCAPQETCHSEDDRRPDVDGSFRFTQSHAPRWLRPLSDGHELKDHPATAIVAEIREGGQPPGTPDNETTVRMGRSLEEGEGKLCRPCFLHDFQFQQIRVNHEFAGPIRILIGCVVATKGKTALDPSSRAGGPIKANRSTHKSIHFPCNVDVTQFSRLTIQQQQTMGHLC